MKNKNDAEKVIDLNKQLNDKNNLIEQYELNEKKIKNNMLELEKKLTEKQSLIENIEKELENIKEEKNSLNNLFNQYKENECK